MLFNHLIILIQLLVFGGNCEFAENVLLGCMSCREELHGGACGEGSGLLAESWEFFLFVIEWISIFMLGVAGGEVLDVIGGAVEETGFLLGGPLVVDTVFGIDSFERGSFGEKVKEFGSGVGFGGFL